MIRKDLRQSNQNRDIRIQLGTGKESDGMANFTIGQTNVIASVVGPAQPKYPKYENAERCKLEINLDLSSNSESSLDESFIIDFLTKSLTSSINLDLFPRMLILIEVAVIRDNGSLVSAALNACTLALLDAGIPMNFFVSCIEISYIASKNTFLLDPTTEEEKQSDSSILISLKSNAEFANLKDSSIINLNVRGTFNRIKIHEALTFCQPYSLSLNSILRESVTSKLANQKY